jgi:hypothetical protein
VKAHIPERAMKANNKAKKINPHLLPHPQSAVQQYRSNGGQITDPDQSIIDPLLNAPNKLDIRLQSFTKRYPSFEPIFHNVVNGNKAIFIDATKYFIDITYRLFQSN